MGTDWGVMITSVLLLLLPAVAVLGIYYIFFLRRGRMRRQRITKRRSHKADESKTPEN